MRTPKCAQSAANVVTVDRYAGSLHEKNGASETSALSPNTDGSLVGAIKQSGDGAWRPLPILGLGVDTPFRIGHN